MTTARNDPPLASFLPAAAGTGPLVTGDDPLDVAVLSTDETVEGGGVDSDSEAGPEPLGIGSSVLAGGSSVLEGTGSGVDEGTGAAVLGGTSAEDVGIGTGAVSLFAGAWVVEATGADVSTAGGWDERIG